jgi:CBS domain-containing protein
VKRVKIADAFGSQPGFEPPAGSEAAIVAVRGGEVVAAVPRGTPDDGAIGAASRLRASLRLENERVLTLDIQEGSGRVFVHAESAHLHDAVSESEPVGAAPRTAESIMSRSVMTASPDELVEDVAKRLAFHNITGMPVEDWDGKIIGVISELDVIGKIGETIRDVMSTELISVTRETPITQIGVLMADRRIKRVPVLDGDELVGIVSRSDIVRALAEHWAETG